MELAVSMTVAWARSRNEDGRGAAQIARRRGAGDGGVDLIPAPGLPGLYASVNQRSMVASASGDSEFAFFTASMRGAHAPCAPGGVWGEVSHNMAEMI
jgi:hypothetical protein